MGNDHRRAAWVILVLTAIGAGGCQRKPKVTINAQACAGTWIEVTDREDPGFPGRYVPPQETLDQIRRLTINPDQTFELQMCRPDGTPIEGEVARGTWKAQGSKIVFTTTENNLDEAQRELVPFYTREPVDVSSLEGTVRRLRMVDQAGNLVVMRPEG